MNNPEKFELDSGREPEDEKAKQEEIVEQKKHETEPEQLDQQDLGKLYELQNNEKELVELGSQLSEEQKQEQRSIIQNAKETLSSFVRGAKEKVPSKQKLFLAATAAINCRQLRPTGRHSALYFGYQ